MFTNGNRGVGGKLAHVQNCQSLEPWASARGPCPPPGFWNFLQKRLFSWFWVGKKQISPLLAPPWKNFGKILQCPPSGKNPSDAHDSNTRLFVIAAFSSPVVWGLFWYTLSLRNPTDRNLGDSSLVSGLPRQCHTSCWLASPEIASICSVGLDIVLLEPFFISTCPSASLQWHRKCSLYYDTAFRMRSLRFLISVFKPIWTDDAIFTNCYPSCAFCWG